MSLSLSTRLLCCKYLSYAYVVIENPSGTSIPFFDKLDIISPKEEFFPPTTDMSSIDVSENHSMFFMFYIYEFLNFRV